MSNPARDELLQCNCRGCGRTLIGDSPKSLALARLVYHGRDLPMRVEGWVKTQVANHRAPVCGYCLESTRRRT